MTEHKDVFDIFYFEEHDVISGDDIDLVVDKCCEAIPEKGYVPAYNFYIRNKNNETVGQINFRVGHTEALEKYAGHIGYTVFRKYRGNHYAAKACNVLRRVIEKHDMKTVSITCNPDNIASQKTLEAIGAEFVRSVNVPEDNEIYQQGEPIKYVYKWNI